MKFDIRSRDGGEEAEYVFVCTGGGAGSAERRVFPRHGWLGSSQHDHNCYRPCLCAHTCKHAQTLVRGGALAGGRVSLAWLARALALLHTATATATPAPGGGGGHDWAHGPGPGQPHLTRTALLRELRGLHLLPLQGGGWAAAEELCGGPAAAAVAVEVQAEVSAAGGTQPQEVVEEEEERLALVRQLAAELGDGAGGGSGGGAAAGCGVFFPLPPAAASTAARGRSGTDAAGAGAGAGARGGGVVGLQAEAHGSPATAAECVRLLQRCGLPTDMPQLLELFGGAGGRGGSAVTAAVAAPRPQPPLLRVLDVRLLEAAEAAEEAEGVEPDLEVPVAGDDAAAAAASARQVLAGQQRRAVLMSCLQVGGGCGERVGWGCPVAHLRGGGVWRCGGQDSGAAWLSPRCAAEPCSPRPTPPPPLALLLRDASAHIP